MTVHLVFPCSCHGAMTLPMSGRLAPLSPDSLSPHEPLAYHGTGEIHVELNVLQLRVYWCWSGLALIRRTMNMLCMYRLSSFLCSFLFSTSVIHNLSLHCTCTCMWRSCTHSSQFKAVRVTLNERICLLSCLYPYIRSIIIPAWVECLTRTLEVRVKTSSQHDTSLCIALHCVVLWTCLRVC